KRIAIFDMCANIAAMFSGYLQAGLYNSFNGRGGLAGLFIMDGVISVPIALLGFFCLPDFPNNTRVKWLTKAEKEFSIKRITAVGKRGPRKLSWRRVKEYSKSWRPYAYLLYIAMLSGPYAPSTAFNLWLKSIGMDTDKVEIIPTAANGLSFVSAYVFGAVSDLINHRWGLILVSEAIRISESIILAVWDIGFHAKFYAYMAPSLGVGYWTLWLSWTQEVFQDDIEFRGLMVAAGNTLGSAFGAWVPLLLFPTKYAPTYKHTNGYIGAIIFEVASSLSVVLFAYLAHRETVKKGRV
ncbi:major facilitator superfamily domain-containing protein, partial [Lipomyces japonicus]|uniref:major facilitator superfamily domain-containing protein n=1 Tax=Lipomyces japonicus TaxID=56871 RepID=UPI0034CF77CB